MLQRLHSRFRDGVEAPVVVADAPLPVAVVQAEKLFTAGETNFSPTQVSQGDHQVLLREGDWWRTAPSWASSNGR